MNATIPLLAQQLAPDNIWFVLLVVVVLALMHSLGSLRTLADARRHRRDRGHGIGHRLQELITPRQH